MKWVDSRNDLLQSCIRLAKETKAKKILELNFTRYPE
jgi:hypothetical protein